jgi:hypothetical protein
MKNYNEQENPWEKLKSIENELERYKIIRDNYNENSEKKLRITERDRDAIIEIRERLIEIAEGKFRQKNYGVLISNLMTDFERFIPNINSPQGLNCFLKSYI